MGSNPGYLLKYFLVYKTHKKKTSEIVLECLDMSSILNKFVLIESNLTICSNVVDSTPPRTPRIRGLKSQIMKPTFLS